MGDGSYLAVTVRLDRLTLFEQLSRKGQMTTKQKGDLLEVIVTQLCSGIENARTEGNVRVVGRSGTKRQIDVLITGTVGAFEVKILVDSKNYASPVDINDVDSLVGMVADVGANLGVIVCPSGYTAGAKKRAEAGGIQLYEVYDQALGNTDLLLPVRYVAPRLGKYQFHMSGTTAAGPFRIRVDLSRLRFHIDDSILGVKDVPYYIWNNQMVPQEKGKYPVRIGAVKITDPDDDNHVQYCDLEVRIQVEEDYFLKLFPASFFRKVDALGTEHFRLNLDAHSNKKDMLEHGWNFFETMEEMNEAADIANQPNSVRELVFRETHTSYPIEELT
jgi:restriction endonuclease